jgi:hypothetical protein
MTERYYVIPSNFRCSIQSNGPDVENALKLFREEKIVGWEVLGDNERLVFYRYVPTDRPNYNAFLFPHNSAEIGPIVWTWLQRSANYEKYDDYSDGDGSSSRDGWKVFDRSSHKRDPYEKDQFFGYTTPYEVAYIVEPAWSYYAK